MSNAVRHTLLAAFACAALAISAAQADTSRSHGDDDDDHNAAREALERGEVLPLGDILDRVEGRLPGRILKVEFEREHGAWVYEFKVLRSDGRRIEVYVDAATATILSQEED